MHLSACGYAQVDARVIPLEKLSEEIENLESDIVAYAISYKDKPQKMIAELKGAIQMHKECLIKLVA